MATANGIAMRKNALNGSGINVTEVCLGTMTWGNQNTEEEAHQQLDHAVLECGVNFIDTAEAYPVPPAPEYAGTTERIVGSWLAKSKVRREDLVVATKVSGPGRQFLAHNRGQREKQESRLEPDQIEAAAKASLERLGTRYIDILYLHWPERPTCNFGRTIFSPEKAQAATPVPFEEQIKGVKSLLDQGIIRAWALSNETAYGVVQHCEAAKKLGIPYPCTIQNDFSLLDRAFERETAEACHYYGIKLTSYGPLAGGMLSNKYSDASSDLSRARHQRFPNFQPRYHLQRAKQAASKYAEIARKHDLSPSQLAIAWQRTRPFLDSVIIGATSMEQLKDDLSPFLHGTKLSDGCLRQVEEVHRECKNPCDDAVSM